MAIKSTERAVTPRRLSNCELLIALLPELIEVKDLRREAGVLKEVVAELTLENRLKQSVTADGEDAA